MGRPHGALTLLLIPILFGAGVAHAQPEPSDPAALFERGVVAYDDGDFSAALEAFEASYRVRAVPAVLYNIGATQMALSRFAQAERTFQRYLAEDGAMTPERRAETLGRLAQLRTRVARLMIHVEPAGAEVRIDGAVEGVAPLPGPVTLDPGEHTIEIAREGHQLEPIALTLPAGFEQTMTLRMRQTPRVLEPARPDPEPRRPVREPDPPRDEDEGGSVFTSPAFWIVAGVVVAGAGAATWYVLRDDRESNYFTPMFEVP